MNRQAHHLGVGAFARRQPSRQVASAHCPLPTRRGVALLQQHTRLGAVRQREVRIQSQRFVDQRGRAVL